jgi:predicted RNase H-like nuclease
MKGKQAVGVDGCRGGWLCFAVGPGKQQITIEVLPDFGEVLKKFPQAVLAVDIPIGLPDQCARHCDVAARKLIGPRRSSVFPAPIRAMLAAQSYENACKIGRAIDGRALSRQCFEILSKIREVDAELSARNFLAEVVEVHPEVSFWALSGKPLDHSKKSSAGRSERLRLLKPVYPEIERVMFDKKLAQSDDLYDAAAAAWTAERIIKRESKVVSETAVDSCGLAMQITY